MTTYNKIATGKEINVNDAGEYTCKGWKGSKYSCDKGAKEVAKELRAYIKENPDLNVCKWSVRSDVRSIYVSLMAAPFDPFSDEYKVKNEYRYKNGYSEHGDTKDYTTQEAYRLIIKVKTFVMQYIRDYSDAMIDYYDCNIYDHYEIGQYDKPFQIIEKKESPKQGEPSKEPNEVKVSEPVVTPEGLEIVNYSEKAIAVFGETKAIKDELKKLGGKFNPVLKHNGEKRAGWIFSKKQTDKVRALLAPSVEAAESVTLPEPPKEINITDVLDEMESKQEYDQVKLYNTSFGIGKAKYVVNFHDGIKRHKDGSRFYDIRIFSNKKEMDKFIKELVKEGYKIDTFFNESETAKEAKKSADILVESIDGNWYTIRLNREIELKSKRIRKYDNGCIAVPESVYKKLKDKYNVMCNF